MQNMGSLFFLRTSSIIGGDVMTILIIYLYVSCILIWYELIAKRKYIKEQMEGIEELLSRQQQNSQKEIIQETMQLNNIKMSTFYIMVN